MISRIRRMARLEVIAGDLISYRECAEITLAMLGLFKAAMVKHIDDPVLLWELLNGMAGDATRTLEPLGYGVAWRVPWSRYHRRLAQLETVLAQRQEIADAEGLKELAEIARAKILDAIDRHKRGEPIPEPTERHDGPHHEVLRQRLNTMRQRLMRFGGIREHMP